jgi:hypothetical protein
MAQGLIAYEGSDKSLAAVNEGQRAMLTQRTPREAVKTRQGKGGRKFSYVPHAWVTEKLNEAFGWAWSWEVTDWRLVPESEPTEVFVLGRLTVHGLRGDLVKTQFGSSDVKRDRNKNVLSIGDDLKAASSDALKKCASLLGIALDLYKSDAPPERDDEREDGSLSSDPMTAFWSAAKAKGLTQQQGAELLQKHKGNPDKALAELAKEPKRPERSTNGKQTKRDKLVARLQELAPKAGVNLDPTWLSEATEAELTAYGKELKGKAEAPEDATEPQSKPATVGTSAWKDAGAKLAKKVPYFQNEDGSPNYYHMLGAAGKCDIEAITDSNLADVIEALSDYAAKQAEPEAA